MAIIKGITLNDLHFGIDETPRLYNELHQVTDFLDEHKDIQLIVIAGDYFDRKLSVGDTATYLAVSFFKKLMDIAKERHIVFRMIQGTLSHELNQLQLFSAYESDPDVDFKIIRTVSDEDVLGLKVLYIPEEYPKDAVEYYKDFKTKNYNIGFVHGTFDFVAFQSQIAHGNQTETNSAPVFIWDEWKEAFKNGFFSVGHIHGRNIYPVTKLITRNTKIFYSGSFTRWGFGERSARGFTYYEYDTDNQSYDVKFIDNTEAPIYDVLSLTEEFKDKEPTIELIKESIEKKKKTAQFIAVDISNLSKDLIGLVKAAYKDDKTIKLENKVKTVMLKESTTSDSGKEILKKYKYIIKRELPLPQILQKFLKEEMGIDLSLDVITEILKEEGKDSNEDKKE